MSRTSNYASAAAELHITQPAIWRQIQALERELGVALFARVGRGVRITAAGETLARKAADVLSELERLTTTAASLSAGRRGAVRVACMAPHVTRVLANVMAQLRRAAPDIDVELREHIAHPDSPPRFDDLLRDGEVDFAVGIPGLPDVERRLLYRAEVVVGLPPRHRWRARRHIDVRDLEGEPLLVAPPAWLSRTQLDAAARAAGFAPTVAFESGSPSTLISLAQAGVGVLVLADDAVTTPSAKWPRLTNKAVVLSSPVELYWMAARPLSAASETFLEILERAVTLGL